MRGTRLLLSGPPGVGKTTIVARLAKNLQDRRLSGFLTQELRERGERRGFRALLLPAGASRTIAHVSWPGPKVGRYGVDVAAIEAIAEATLGGSRVVDLYLVDEIGRMECLAPGFVAAVRRLLDSAAPLVATVAARGAGLVEEVKHRAGVEVWTVTRGNRDDLPRLLEERLGSTPGSPSRPGP